PVTLTAEEPVAQLVVDTVHPDVPALNPICNGGNTFIDIQAVKRNVQFRVRGVYITTVTAPALITGDDWLLLSGIFNIGREDAGYFEAEFLSKLNVAIIMCRYGHDRPGTVSHKHVVGHPDGYLFVVDRVDGPGACEDTG